MANLSAKEEEEEEEEAEKAAEDEDEEDEGGPETLSVSNNATVHAPSSSDAIKLSFWEYYLLTLTIMVCVLHSLN
ncbi:hypothetical protein FQA39_LY16622 [Lamprigera yunnana]|nr:hypothetical protein FQA39_LY16622 [Lamprigera yunnana]